MRAMSKKMLVAGSVSLLLASACAANEVSDDGTSAAAESSTTPAPGESGEDSIMIGGVHPMTGGLALDGNQMSAAAQMAVEEINAAGGIEALDGAQLEYVQADSQGQPETGQAEAQRLIERDAVALIGTYQSAVTSTMASLAERSGVPFVIDVAVDDDIITENSRYTFRLQPNATRDGVVGAESLVALAEDAGLELSRVAYLYDETAFGTSIYGAFKERAEELGLEIVEAITFNPFEVSDMTTELARVGASGADVLLVTGYYDDGILIARNAFDVAPDVEVVMGIASGAFDVPAFPEDAGAAAAENILNVNYHFDQTLPEVQDLLARFEERTGDRMRTSAVLSYQAIQVIAAGLESAGSVERDDLRDAISANEVPALLTFTGPISFTQEGENANASPSVQQVQDGEIVQVYPEEVAEAEPRFPAVPWE